MTSEASPIPNWPAGWRAVADPAEQDALLAQLSAELSAGHVLHGKALGVIARRDDSDDVVVSLDNGRFAEVHLTWSPQPDLAQAFPGVTIFASLAEWKAAAAD